MLLNAELNIIDAAVPSDLDSPLKPTTPYADKTITLPSTSDDVTDPSSLRPHAVVDSQSSQEQYAVSFDADSDLQNSDVPVQTELSQGEFQGHEKQSNDTVDDDADRLDSGVQEGFNDDNHAVASVSNLPSTVCHGTSSDYTTDEESGLTTDSLPKSPQSVDKSAVTVRSSSASVKAFCRPVSMPPEMTIIEDEKLEDTSILGTNVSASSYSPVKSGLYVHNVS